MGRKEKKQSRKMKVSFAAAALAIFASSASAKKKCPGHFGGSSKVANLCESHFPDKGSEKVWFIKFYAPWCGHCQSMKQDWSDLAKEFKDDKEIGIGGVDCD